MSDVALAVSPRTGRPSCFLWCGGLGWVSFFERSPKEEKSDTSKHVVVILRLLRKSLDRYNIHGTFVYRNLNTNIFEKLAIFWPLRTFFNN